MFAIFWFAFIAVVLAVLVIGSMVFAIPGPVGLIFRIIAVVAVGFFLVVKVAIPMFSAVHNLDLHHHYVVKPQIEAAGDGRVDHPDVRKFGPRS